MLQLLAIGLALSAVPGEEDDEPVDLLLTADVGSLPRAVMEVEKPMSRVASAFLTLGSANLAALSRSASGPQVAVGGRMFPRGRGPWGLFVDGRLLVNMYFSAGPQAPATLVPGGAFTIGLSAQLWRAVVSSGLSLYYVPDPIAGGSVLYPSLRLAVGGWTLTPGSALREVEGEPVSFLVTADLGSLPRASLELEAPMVSWGSAFVSLGYPIPIGINFTDRIPGPQIAAGWRLYPFGPGPWGPFVDGRLLANLYFPLDRTAPSPIVIPGGGLTVGLNARVWHVVVSPGIALLFVPDPAAGSAVLPALRLAAGGWN